MKKDPALPGMPAVKVKFNDNYDQEQYKKTNLTANSSRPCTDRRPESASPLIRYANIKPSGWKKEEK